MVHLSLLWLQVGTLQDFFLPVFPINRDNLLNLNVLSGLVKDRDFEKDERATRSADSWRESFSRQISRSLRNSRRQ